MSFSDANASVEGGSRLFRIVILPVGTHQFVVHSLIFDDHSLAKGFVAIGPCLVIHPSKINRLKSDALCEQVIKVRRANLVKIAQHQPTTAGLDLTGCRLRKRSFQFARVIDTSSDAAVPCHGEASEPGEARDASEVPDAIHVGLNLQIPPSLALHLEVGKTDETITVTADTSLLNYENQTLEGGVVWLRYGVEAVED